MKLKKTSSPGRVLQEPMLSNTGPKRRGSPVPVILVLLILGAGGDFGWKAFESRQAAKRAKEAEYQRWLAERERLRNLPEPETNVVEKVEVVKEPEPPPEPGGFGRRGLARHKPVSSGTAAIFSDGGFRFLPSDRRFGGNSQRGACGVPFRL